MKHDNSLSSCLTSSDYSVATPGTPEILVNSQSIGVIFPSESSPTSIGTLSSMVDGSNTPTLYNILQSTESNQTPYMISNDWCATSTSLSISATASTLVINYYNTDSALEYTFGD